MGQNRHPLRRFAIWCTLCTLVLALAAPVCIAASDPVEDLRWALAVPVQDLPDYDRDLAKRLQGVTPQEQKKLLLQARDEQVAKCVNALRSLPQIRRALMLDSWRETPDEEGLTAMDRKYQAELAEGFARQIRRTLQDDSVARRLAALAMLIERGRWGENPVTRWQDPATKRRLSVTLTVDVAAVARRDKDTEVRAAAARALGRMSPDLEKAIQVLQGLLGAKDASERRAAAEGLADLIETASMIVEEARFSSQAEPTPSPEVLRTGRSVLPVAAQGIGDSDAQVQRLCLEAFRQTALALKKQIPEVRLEVYPFFPYEGLNVTPQAIAKIHGALRPMVQVMHDQLPKMASALGDADLTVSLAANQALEAIGGVRQRLLGLTAPATRFGLGEAKPPPSEDLLGPGLESMVPSLAALLPHKDIRIRLAALYVLETLETKAAPAVKGVVQALDDRDAFVRWAAVRALGKMAPRAAAEAVPTLARLLDEEKNLDVRITTAAALERYGPAAKAAVPALDRAIGKGPLAVRSLTIKALAAIGNEAQPAVPSLIGVLSAPEASLRAEAAEALGKISPMAPATVEALRKALNDSEAEVSQAAGDALLAGN